MSKGLKLILNLLLLFCLVACSRSTNVSPLLKKAEEYMNERPDSALYLLDSIIRPEALSNEDKVLWSLLITQARDKKRVTHTSDSLINIAVHYYDEKGNIERRAQAYYCQGRVYMDMLLFDEAIISFLKAEELVLQTTDYNLQARIYNQLGDLSKKNLLYKDALLFYQRANASYRLDKSLLGEVFTLRDIGLAYENLAQLDSAIFYLKKSLDISQMNNWNNLSNTILVGLSSVFESMCLYQDAINLLNQSISLTQNESLLYSSYYSLGSLYRKTGQIDSAFCYLDKASGSPNLYIQCQQNREYSALLYDRKDYKAAYEHNNQYILLRDSIEHLYLPDKLAEVEARYNHEKLINEKNQLVLKRKNAIFVFSVLIIAMLVLLILLVVRYQEKLHQKLIMIKEMEHNLSESQSEVEINKALLIGKENELRLKVIELEKNMTARQSLGLVNNQREEVLAQRNKVLNEEIANLQNDIKEKDSLYENKLHELSLKKKELRDNKVKMESVEAEKQRLENMYSEKTDTLNKQIVDLQNEINEKESVIKGVKESTKSLVRKYLEVNSPQMKRLFDRKDVVAEYTDEEWKTFEEQFNVVYPKFIKKLCKNYPTMNKKELRLCCLFLLGVKTAKISAILALAPNTISKYSKDIFRKYFVSYGEKSLEDMLDDIT